MKTLNLFVLAFATLLMSCGDKAKEAETKTAEKAAEAKKTAVTFNAVSNKSTINWKGFKPTGSHTGTIAIADGTVKVEDGKLTSGAFNIDMKSIVVTDIPADDEDNGKLVGHLTSADFFDAETYPTAKFEVTGLKTIEGKTMLSGNLTLKDATNNISFPVTSAINGNTMTLKSETFTIDRSKWNVKYGSKSFFDNLGDQFINDDIELTINLVAEKKA